MSDRYDDSAHIIIDAYKLPCDGMRDAIAVALRAAERRGAESMRERAAGACERMVIGGRAWTEEQAIAAAALLAASDEIRALPLEVDDAE